MFKWIRKKILEGVIKDLLEQLPDIKEKGLQLLKEKKELIIEKIKETIKKALLELVEKF